MCVFVALRMFSRRALSPKCKVPMLQLGGLQVILRSSSDGFCSEIRSAKVDDERRNGFDLDGMVYEPQNFWEFVFQPVSF